MTSLSRPLLQWFKKYGRALPWRETQDPYRILVSEIMLQQTQVSRVLGYYERWFKVFPTWKALAKATNAEVIHAWAGLGYNRRGLMLRDIAKQIVEHGVPQSEAEWQTLKGIGPYTAAALAAFSLHAYTMPVDTNIRRVLGRVLLNTPFAQGSDDERIRTAAVAAFPRRGAYWNVPQALFDLAVLTCKKRPECEQCPLRASCPAAKGFLAGTTEIPKASVKKAKETIHSGKSHPDRIYRGRILRLVREHPGIMESTVGKKVDLSFTAKTDAAWMRAMIDRLEQDGMITRVGRRLHLVH